ncbi:helix-turn-helix transcriptional regulator [Actinopolymorpha alba]|uniref:helix-turn-helix transcriptional regulator n=1 Tax=Actinopolymorpha alba TaxID=533267 RepID=UPI00036ACD5D|nr:AraC family transcriptional regulator [Actinopolymorpha alba]
MAFLTGTCTFWRVDARTRIVVSDAPVTRLGQLVLAGEVVDEEPVMPSSLRVMDAFVISFVVDGYGSYRHADGHEQPITPGALTVVEPGQPHWYGTAPGERWTELFAVFSGPLFDTLAEVGVIKGVGPRHPRSAPSAAALRTVLSATPRSQLAAEHQLLALADWLVDTAEPGGASGLSPAIATAVDRLAADLAAPISLRTVAAEVGLPYDTFRRRFTGEVGTSPLAFRNGRRLQRAATLLRLTDMTTREIARTLGFTDEFHFSRRFRAHFGLPPRDYRRS